MDESMQFIDLHTHSQASDGTDSPGQLVRNAHAQGLAAKCYLILKNMG